MSAALQQSVAPAPIYRGGWVFAEHPSARHLASVIPHARSVQAGQRDLLALPHSVESMDTLRSLGIKCDAPVNHDGFLYPGRYVPFAHQKETVAFLTTNDRGFCFDDPGCGKTAACVWAAEYLMQKGLIRRVLVISTLSTMRDVWEREIFNLTPNRTAAVAHGSNKDRRTATIRDPRIEWVIMNHDGVPHNLEALQAASDLDLVIIDECTAFKNPTSNRFKALRKVCARPLDYGPVCRVWALTGTPIAQSPVDAWAMCRIICPERVPASYTLMKDTLLMKIGMFKWVPRKDAVAKVYDMMQPAIRHAKADCLDLPPVVQSDRMTTLSAQQKQALGELQRLQKVTLASGKSIVALNAAIEVSKRLQVCSGIVIDENGNPLSIDADARLSAINDLIDESASKTVVFCAYKGALRRVVEYLEGQGKTVAWVDGSVSEGKRSAIFRAFQNDPDPQVLVAHPKTTSHGLTLTAASTVVWNGPVMSSETYKQGNGRIDRPGQAHVCRVVHLLSAQIEEKMFKVTRDRGLTENDLLDLYNTFN